MLTERQRAHLKLAVRTMQVIVGALAAGVLTFVGVVLAVVRGGVIGGQLQQEPLITHVAAGFAVVAAVLWGIVPGLITSRMRQAIAGGNKSPLTTKLSNAAEVRDVAPLTVAYQSRLIVGAALLEGAAFFNLIVYMLEQQPLSLVAAGVLLLIMLTQIPTVSRLEAWVESELSTIEQLRQMGSFDAR